MANDDDSANKLVTRTLAMAGRSPRIVRDKLEFARTAALHPDATLRTREDAKSSTIPHGSPGMPSEGHLVLGATLGEGGMGLVRVGTQRALGRDVAVKSLLPGAAPEDAIHLFREAWVSGALEHPNIVPVYDLTRDEQGGPLLIMKLIDGAPWSSLLRSQSTVRSRFGVTDAFSWHLRVLIQVCQAIAMAHAKGIVHRDLKPDNVLIGSFGQVYVADWGIAASVREDPTGRMPHVRELPLAGTPSYMAPEMWGAEVEKIGPRTDVYLLGGILHEILTGKPPHDGSQFIDVVSLKAPRLALENMPAEVQAICARALEPDPEHRFASVDELRQELEAFLDHRGAHELVRAAGEKLRAAEDTLGGTKDGETIAAPRPNGETAALKSSGDTRMRVLALISEARFGFREALAAWPENRSARAGLERAVRVGVGYELARGAADAAESLLAELPDAPADLRKKVDTALREKAKRIEQLEKLRAEYDPNVGRTTRLAAALILGLFLIVIPHVLAHFNADKQIDPLKAYRADLVLLFVTGALAFWGRESLRKTAINRGFVRVAVFIFVAQLVVALGTTFGPLAREALFPMRFFGPLCALGATALLIEIRLLPAVFSYLIGMFVEAVHPEYSAYVSSATNFVTITCFAVAWFYPRKAPEPSPDSHVEPST